MLSGHKCLVTGASSGIGQATCAVLHNSGAMVIGTGRNQGALEAMKQSGNSIQDFVIADLTKQGECQRVVDKAATLLNGLTAVVNAAGLLQGGPIDDITMENYHYNMTANTQVPFEILLHSIPHLKKYQQQQQQQQHPGSVQVSPSVVTVSSVTGKQSFANCISYCMSKAAVDQMTRCASVDLAKYGIRVNAVNPGVVETPLHKTGGMTNEAYERFLERSITTTHPLAAHMGRVTQPQEVGELIAFLLSNQASFITGECIAIDGGRQNLGSR